MPLFGRTELYWLNAQTQTSTKLARPGGLGPLHVVHDLQMTGGDRIVADL